MKKKKEHSGIFEDKKKTARIMRNVFIVVAVLYVGLIIWSLCRQNYVVALFNVVILLMDIGYVYWCNALISDADLAISAIECERSRCNLIDAISRNHPWIRSDERWPNNEGRIFMYDTKSGDINDAYSIGKGVYWDEDGLNHVEINDCHFMEYWMPIPTLSQKIEPHGISKHDELRILRYMNQLSEYKTKALSSVADYCTKNSISEVDFWRKLQEEWEKNEEEQVKDLCRAQNLANYRSKTLFDLVGELKFDALEWRAKYMSKK